MKILKKSLALTLAVLMLLTSMTITSFAEETATEGTSDKYTSVTKWMYPYWDGSTKDSNNNPLITSKTLKADGKTTETDNYSIVWKNGISSEQTLVGRSPFSAPDGAPTDYKIIRQSVSTSWTGRTGVEYRPKLSDANYPYYELYVDLVDHANNVAADLKLEVITEFGKYVTDLEAIEATSGATREERFIGVVKLSDAASDRISILLPTENITAGQFISVGGILLKQLNVKKDATAPTNMIKYNEMITKWVYPTAHTDTTNHSTHIGSHKGEAGDANDFNSVVFRNGTPNSYLDLKANSSATSTETNLPKDYVLSRTGLGAAWTKKSGIVYETVLSNKVNPYYEVWVELFGHDNGEDVGLKLEIVGDDGTYTTILPKENDTPVASGGTWRRTMHRVGVVKLSSPDFNTISLLLPCDRTYYDNVANKEAAGFAETNTQNITRKDFMAFGGVKLVQVNGVPSEDQLLKLERSVNIIEPRADLYTQWNGFGTGGGKYEATPQIYTSFELEDKYELNVTDKAVERSNGTSYNMEKASRHTNIYKGLWADSEAQAGWYKLYIDKLAHKGTTPIPYFTIQVTHEGGISEYIMDRNLPSDDDKTDWNQSRHYIGTFNMRHGGEDQIRIYFPKLVDGGTKEWRADLGAILCVPVTEEEAIAAKTAELTAEKDLYLKPVYSADFKADFPDNGDSVVEYYQNGGYHQLYLDASEGKTSIKTVAYDKASDDLKKALEFDEGILDFDLYWTYNAGAGALTAAKAPYFSVILGKSATQSAEIRIYMDKAQLIEGDVVTDLYIPTDYYYYLATAKEQGRTLKTTGWKPNCRIEITDVANANLENGLEATSRSKSKDGAAGATKLLKVFLFGLTGSEVCIGANYIPADSVLYDEDEVLTDNYIEFVNYPGETIDTELQNLLKVRNLSVAEPDTTITNGDLVEEVVTDFTDAGAYKMNAYIPFKHSNKLCEGEISKEYAYAIGAYKGDALVDVDAYEKEILNGDKTTIDLSVDVSNAEKFKLFQWNNFDKMVPYVSAVQK